MLAAQGDWTTALKAADAATWHVRQLHWRGVLLDRAALAAQKLSRARAPGITLTGLDRRAAIDAMRMAAEKRVDGILGNSRRQHYGHAALLVASCVAFAPKSRGSESPVMGRGYPSAVLASPRLQIGAGASA